MQMNSRMDIEQQMKKGKENKEINQTLFLILHLDTSELFHLFIFAKVSMGIVHFLTEENTVSEADKMILGQVALACSLHLLNERTRFNTEQRLRGSFLEDILSKRITKSEIVDRAHYIDFELNSPYFMVAIHRQFEESSMKEEIEFNDQFMNDLFKFFQKQQSKWIIRSKIRKCDYSHSLNLLY